MKALKKICTALMLLAFAFVFASCSNDSDDDDQSITLSDGSYTLAITKTSDGMVEKYDIKATASNESWTFKSGSKTQNVDLTKQMTTDELTAFNKKDYDVKKAEAKEHMKFPDDAEVSFDDNKVIAKSNLSDAELTEMQEDYKLSSIPSDAKIKTIKDKTEYEITMSTKEWETIVFHVNKD
ncbi:hypothetical protein [uncultured Treponema sp.]|uniref:hypothetical protein n=1 Tax=uncultured Treponema sp. TaxID=162155 RepID=UPI00258E75D1|nr:hypothetical protein [uncultured Treponema sp.]